MIMYHHWRNISLLVRCASPMRGNFDALTTCAKVKRGLNSTSGANFYSSLVSGYVKILDSFKISLDKMNLSIKNQTKPKFYTDFSIESIIGQQRQQQQQSKRFRPKNFHCSECGMAFSNNGQLRTHLRIHTGERPFRCDHSGCNKTFTRNEELTRHKLIHSGVRPHACGSCDKRFGRKDHLKKHTRTHEKNQTQRAQGNFACLANPDEDIFYLNRGDNQPALDGLSGDNFLNNKNLHNRHRRCQPHNYDHGLLIFKLRGLFT